MRGILRVAFLALLTLVIVGAFWSQNHAEHLANKGAAETKFVTLVIDYGAKSGKPIQRFEVPDAPANASGWDLFKFAGVRAEGTEQYPTGFVCRLNDWPSAAAEDCKQTPAYAKGHWAYFVTNRSLGSGWILSGQGAAAHIPDCGSFEGWSWIAGGANSTAPRFDTKIRGCK